MSKTNRYFDIIQLLRAANKPVLARDIAEQMEVSVRTVYRDIAALQARDTPIYGEAGIGYVMRKGYDLPPLSFDDEEAEAVFIGLSMIARTGDTGLWKAATRALKKLSDVVPESRQLVISSWGVSEPDHAELPLVRDAIREEQKLCIDYRDSNGIATERITWPLALIYYADNAVLVAWCELRHALRHFRLDRINRCTVPGSDFSGQGSALLTEWESTLKHEMVDSRIP